jgi:hypothetical protein
MGSLTFTSDSIQDLSGKVFIVTGGNSGLVRGCCRLRLLRLHCTKSRLSNMWDQPYLLGGHAACPTLSHRQPLVWTDPQCAVTQGYETALQLALHNGHVILATHSQDSSAPMPADEVDGPG